jgi:transposase
MPKETPREKELSEKLALATAENARVSDELAELRTENKLLREKVEALIRRLFGAQSEKLDREQLLLMLQGFDAQGKSPEPVAAEAPRRSTAASPPRERRQPRLPEHLPVVEEMIVPEAVKVAPQDWRRIGEEVSERLDYEPARFLRRRTVRPKYVQRGVLDAVPIVAPLPDSLLERSLVAPGLLAQIVVSKYCDHLPLYRQESIYWTRHQVWLPRQTMAEWVALAAEWLKPVYQQIRRDVLSRGYVQIDETPIRYLAPGNGKTRLGYLWTCGVPRGDAIFHWETSRAARAWTTSSPPTSTAPSSATATRPTTALPAAAAKPSSWQAAWPTCAANFTKPATPHPKSRHGSSPTSSTSMPSKPGCATPAPARTSAQQREQARASPCSHGCTAPSCA